MIIIKKAKERTAEDNRKLRNTVSDIIDNVCANGDSALREYSERFDGFVRESFRVSREEIEAAYAQMDPAEIEDLKAAKGNIQAFAEAQLASMSEVKDFSPQPGVFLGHRIIPVSSCCCYVPRLCSNSCPLSW